MNWLAMSTAASTKPPGSTRTSRTTPVSPPSSSSPRADSKSSAARAAEGVDAQVADPAVLENGRADVLADDDAAPDGKVEGLALAVDGQADVAVARPADESHGVFEGAAIQVLAVDRA